MKKIAAIALVLALLSIPTMSVNACWVYLTVDELFEISETIIIGTIVDKENMKNDQIEWTINVEYYLKGEQEVIIFPAYTANENISIHIDLGSNGQRLLLFLGEDGQVISPQGVYDLAIEPEYEQLEVANGKDLLSLINLYSYDDVFITELEERISSLPTIESMFDSEDVDEEAVNDTLVTASAGIIGLLALLLLTRKSK